MPLNAKDSRIDLRIKDSQKRFLVYASSLRNAKLSSFVLDSALKEAEALVAETSRFSLSEKQWKAFLKAMDRPPRKVPKLARLFTGPSVFDEAKRSA